MTFHTSNHEFSKHNILNRISITNEITMNEYDIKRGHFEKIEGDKLKMLMKDIFESVDQKDGKLSTSYGAIEKLVAWPEGKQKLWVETKMNTDVDDKIATETIRKYNLFLEKATGFTAKERRKRAK